MDKFVKENGNVLIFFVNGKKVIDSQIDPEWTLLRYLRQKLRLPGVKLGCGEGGCGACTVMVSQMDRKTGNVKHFSVNACLTPIGAMHGLSVTTTEGIGSTKTRLHPVQERLAKAHGSQCGFCTPGFVMSMYTLLRNNPKPTMEEIEESLVGNLCRCTGYRPILEGFRTFSKEATEVNGCGRADCCMKNGVVNGEAKDTNENGHTDEEFLRLEKTSVLFDPNTFLPYDPSQEVIFPPELKLSPELDSQSLVFEGPRSTFYRPVTLKEVLRLKRTFPEAKIVIGNTEVGVEIKFKNQNYPVIIYAGNIPELLRVTVHNSFLEVGSAVPLTDVEQTIKTNVKRLPGYKTKVLQAIYEMLKLFAGRQIRNVAGFGGNIMTGSPISDLNPILMAAGAKILLKSIDNEREVNMDDTFFTGYRTNIARKDEVLVSVKIPFTTENEHFMAYKQARRRDDDIAIVNSAMKASFEPESSKVSSIALAFGGMAPTTVMAKKTMEKLTGSVWDEKLLDAATSSLLNEMKLEPSAPGGMVDYRCALTASFFFKFYLHVGQELVSKGLAGSSTLKMNAKQPTEASTYSPPKSTQFFQNVPENQDKIDPVGQPIAHIASLKQATGEAIYIDDLPAFENELCGVLVTSSRAHAKIINIDCSKALAMEGVLGFFSAKDLPGERNKTGYIMHDEDVFAADEVKCVGQVVGIVVATEQSLAERAAKSVKIDYEDIPNPIFTIEEAIKAGSLWDPFEIDSGNVEEAFQISNHVLEGEIRLGGQEHFYLEPNVHIAIPGEGDEMEILCSAQNLTVLQKLAAKALDIPSHLVTCKVKRIGGGFGGKQARPTTVAIPAAVAAASLKRPVRITLDRHEDMLITGGRQPFLGRWKVGFNKDGTVNAMETKLYSNAGWSLDLCGAIIQKAIFNANGVYKIKNIRVRGQCCKTNLPSNTAFRGFGTSQAMIIMENVMANISDFLEVDATVVKEKNIYENSGGKTHFGQEISDCTIKRCWKQVLSTGEYYKRKTKVEKFNRLNTLKKRGLSAVPLKFCIGFGPSFLNQAGALVHVYTDGTVLLSHGGMEMGQGLHTKMIQVASRVLGIPMDKIYISETATDKVPNASATAASVSSDTNGMAIVEACTKILNRLEPYRSKMPKASWKDWVLAAFFDRVSLSATGFYKVPGISQYNFENPSPAHPFAYITYGAAVSEVEIDCLTGDHQVLRTDIVMDVGNSLNPAIDIGQIEGAFLQGYGLLTMEQLLYSPKGELLTKGPGAYKIPSVMDIPREFNVSLLRDSSNPRAVFSSKAVGEPPLLSAASVFYAIREAVKAARGNTGKTPLQFDSPATAERIRMACSDWITQKITPPNPGFAGKPWSIDVSN